MLYEYAIDQIRTFSFKFYENCEIVHFGARQTLYAVRVP